MSVVKLHEDAQPRTCGRGALRHEAAETHPAEPVEWHVMKLPTQGMVNASCNQGVSSKKVSLMT
jgi:hypothetical protein